MINYETLLSAYDDKLTLMQWLKKVEAALKDASAVSFHVNKRGDATLTFSVVFEDGTELESEPIVLQQGESVQAATIRNGYLILTLTNGDELNAGNLGGVSGFSINASHHLIVTYQNGTTQDLGAIFTGNVVINGNFEVTGRAKLPIIEGGANNRVTIDDDVIINDSDLTLTDGRLSTPIITSASDEIEAEKPIVEVMTGYSFTPQTIAGLDFEYIYAGCAKNGNKLTFVLAMNVTKTASLGTTNPLGAFTIPSNVMAKLNLTQVGQYALLGCGELSITSDALNYVRVPFGLIRSGNVILFDIMGGGFASMTLNTKYFVRFEVTFLLGNNLAA